MYSPKALALRRCTALKKDGTRCRCWATWDRPDLQQCGSHQGRCATRKPYRRRGVYDERTRYVPCRCIAYNWPHRPGGGVCQWPDQPREYLTTPAGTHGDGGNLYLALEAVRDRRRRGGTWPPADDEEVLLQNRTHAL